MSTLPFEEPLQRQWEALARASDDPEIAPLLRQLRAMDGEAVVRAMERELDDAFAIYRGLVQGKPPLSSIRFYWAGDDVEPWVPSDVWGTGYTSHALEGGHGTRRETLFRDRGSFTPEPLLILFDAADGSDTLVEHASFWDVKSLFVLQSFQWAALALRRATTREPFLGLSTHRPFVLLGTGGHDQGEVYLHVVEG